jgi:hypothetical protein
VPQAGSCSAAIFTVAQWPRRAEDNELEIGWSGSKRIRSRATFPFTPQPTMDRRADCCYSSTATPVSLRIVLVEPVKITKMRLFIGAEQSWRLCSNSAL